MTFLPVVLGDLLYHNPKQQGWAREKAQIFFQFLVEPQLCIEIITHINKITFLEINMFKS